MKSGASTAAVTWDYTDHADHYDKRADYSHEAIEELLRSTGCTPATPIAEVGAGTGKLTKELLRCGLTVRSVEPNDAMRAIGIRNTSGGAVTWSIGTGEATGLRSKSAHAVFFGSSFNVVDQSLTLIEVSRVLQSRGWFGCMWNHRNLDDPIQMHIESIIKSSIPGYTYGSRREDPTNVIKQSGQFSDTKIIERSFGWKMPGSDIIVAWRSHATLKRQAGSEEAFARIIDAIAHYVNRLPALIEVPYTTRIYYAQLLT